MKKVQRAALPKIKTIEVAAGVRYWEDSRINGEQDTEVGNLIPFKDGENWCPVIDAETGIIRDWPKGTTASIHYKVVDNFSAMLKDKSGNVIVEIEDEYVPYFMSPGGDGYGDYVVMKIDGEGKIDNWLFEDEMVTNDKHDDD